MNNGPDIGWSKSEVRLVRGKEQSFPAFWLFGVLSALLCWVLGSSWVQANSGVYEIAYYQGAIPSFIHTLLADGFLSWWNPTSMGGYSMAGTISFAGAMPLYSILIELFGMEAGFKIGALLYWWAGGLAAYGLGRAVSGSSWGGVAVGSFYLLSAQVLLRLAWVEHVTIVACYPFVPLAFWGLWRSARRGAPMDFLLLAAAFSLAWLSASKIGATLAIGLAFVGLGLFWSRPEWRPQLWRGGVVVALLVGWLGVLPVVSLLREFNFMAVFAFAPFAEWQQVFSQPAVVSGLDRGGELLAGLPEAMLVARGGYYLTWLGVGALAGVVWWNWRADRSRLDWLLALKIFAGASLSLQWLSHGARSVLTGQAYLLSEAQGLADPVIVVVWGALIGACLLLWWLVPHDARHPARRGWIYAGLLVVYLLVPGFRLFELLPPLANLRAPDTFWILAGTCCWSVTAGLAVLILLSALSRVRWRIGGGIAAGIILLAEASHGLVYFTREGMPKAVLEEFDEAMEVLREQPEQGWVLPLSGRYFYMQTPWKSGKPLWTEAGHSNFMLFGMARLQALAWSDRTLLRDASKVGGVRYILIDRNDPQLDRTQAERWEKEGQVLYEGEEILLVRNLRALPLAYRATEWVTTGDSLVDLVQGLSLAEFSVAAVAEPGRRSEGPISPEIEQRGEFVPLVSESINSGEWRIALDGREGLVVLAQAWHPDWQAHVDGQAVPVVAAWGALCAVVVPEGAGELVFSFRPPWWYGAGLKVGLMGWGLVLLGLLAWPWQRFWPESWRKFFLASREMIPGECPVAPETERVVVLIPTHNESASIERLLRDLRREIPRVVIWVIDDASTDGTREIVRSLGGEYPEVRLIERPTKAGLGSAYREAMAQVLADGESGGKFSIVLTMDGDGSHHADDARRLLERVRSGEADVAVGSRYLPDSRVENWPRGRLWLSRGATWYVRGWTGLPLTDATSGVKAMRVEALRSIAPQSLRAEGYAFQIELHFRLWQAGFRLIEEPIVFTERAGGCSKMNPGIVREAFWRVPALVFRP